MVKDCMSSGSGFVITLSNTNDSGESFMSQGTFVEIIDFNQLPNGLLGITVKGSQKVSIKSVEQTEAGLHLRTRRRAVGVRVRVAPEGSMIMVLRCCPVGSVVGCTTRIISLAENP